MSDAEKLSRPSFQKEKSGAELSVSGNTTRTGQMTKRTVRYEQIIIDSNYKRFTRRLFAFFGSLFRQFLRGNAVALSPQSRAFQKQLDPLEEPLLVQEEGFAVVTNHNNKAVTELFASESEAREYMQMQIEEDAKLATALDVVPQFEVNVD
jgi:hypothetical protein